MAEGIYINPTTFATFAELERDKLTEQIASREKAWDWTGFIGLLPDPDPILRKMGQDVEVLESLTADGHLCSEIAKRKTGTLSRELLWKPGTRDDKTSPASEQLCSALIEDLENTDMEAVISGMLDAPLYGLTPLELHWQPVKGKIRLTQIEPLPARWFGFNEENESRFISIGNPWEGEELPWGKFVFARHQPTYDNPYGLRLLSRCFWPVTFKKGGLKFWVQFLEKYGAPFLLGHYSRNDNEDKQAKMLASLERMVRTAVGVVPEDAKVEQIGGDAAKGESGHERFISAMNAEISKVVVGQTLTSEAGDKGSYGLGKVHESMLEALQDADRRLVVKTLARIAAIYGEINAPGVPVPVPSFYEEEDPAKEWAERDKILQEADERLHFTDIYYQRRYRLQEDDFELVDPEAKKELEKPADFAEHDAPDQVQLAEEVQVRLDGEVAEAVADAGDIFAEHKIAIRQWLKEFEDIGQCLAAIDQQPRLSDSKLRESIFDALMLASQHGQNSVAAETQNFAETVWGKGKPFREALEFFRAKSFVIGGCASADLAAAVKGELEQALDHGSTMAEFRNSLDELFVRHGLDPISNHRIDTIYRTNMQSAYMAGRYAQLSKASTLKARPYWRYVAVRDGNTRPAHGRMHGLVAHHTNPIWDKWYPPNGFNCRCTVVSLSEREVERDKLHITERDISGQSFEVLNKDTGEIKSFALTPDEGFGNNQSKSGWEEIVATLSAKAETWPDKVAEVAVGSMVESEVFASWYKAPQGSWPVAVLSEEQAVVLGSETRAMMLGAKLAASSELAAADYGMVQATVAGGEQSLSGNTITWTLNTVESVNVVKARIEKGGIRLVSFTSEKR